MRKIVKRNIEEILLKFLEEGKGGMSSEERTLLHELTITRCRELLQLQTVGVSREFPLYFSGKKYTSPAKARRAIKSSIGIISRYLAKKLIGSGEIHCWRFDPLRGQI